MAAATQRDTFRGAASLAALPFGAKAKMTPTVEAAARKRPTVRVTFMKFLSARIGPPWPAWRLFQSFCDIGSGILNSLNACHSIIFRASGNMAAFPAN
jgi:uncharacterized protein (DUF736 family)